MNWLSLFALFSLVLPTSAHAHTTIKGMGDFVSGLAHPLTTPAHVLVILGLALLLGQHTPLKLKMPMLVFGPLSAVALLLTTTGIVKSVPPPFLICIALVAAIFVALEKPLPPLWCGALFAVAAIGVGFDSRVENGSTGVVIKTLAGTWISLMALVCDLAFYVSFCTRKKWQRIGIRVAGSWIIAISLLMLAFSLRR